TLVSLQPRRAQPFCFGWRIGYFLDSIIVKIGGTQLDREIQTLAKPPDGKRHAVSLLISIECVEPVFARDGCSANGQHDVAFLQSAMLGGRIRTKRTQPDRLPVLPI